MSIEDIHSLPISPYLDKITDSLADNYTVMLHAETGAGKTTLVPWKLLSHKAFAEKKIILLQPRRIAARAAADRIAALLGEKIGQRIGLRTRTETYIGRATHLEVVTEGILTRIIQNDQSLAGYDTIIFDEFHERTLQADMALAFTLDCRETLRPDIKLLFMSATPPSDEIESLLGPVQRMTVPGRAYQVKVAYRPPRSDEKPWDGVARLASEAKDMLGPAGGGILVFLPGFREIRRAQEALVNTNENVSVLHGQLSPEEQRNVLNPPSTVHDRIILATNVAETSVTIPDVRAVVDSGLERRVRYLPRTGMDHWDTVSISAASAEQRTGRAGRLGPGLCLRWWHESDPRAQFSPPEIMESDLAPLVLETALWGASSPYNLKWLTQPPQAAVQRATQLLHQLGLIDQNSRITSAGIRAANMGMHPRLGRMIISAAEKGLLATAALTAAFFEEGGAAFGDDPDFRDRLEAWKSWNDGAAGVMPEGPARRIADELRRIIRAVGKDQQNSAGYDIDTRQAGKLILLAYPERAARKTNEDRSHVSRWVLATGRGAQVRGPLSREKFLAVADLDGGDTDARVFLAAPITIGDLESGLAGAPTDEYLVEWNAWTPRARITRHLGKLILNESVGELPPPEEIANAVRIRLLQEELNILPWNDDTRRFVCRCRFVQEYGRQNDWPDFTDKALADNIESWLLPFAVTTGGPVFTEQTIQSALEHYMGWERRRTLDTLAPEHYQLPSGTNKRIDYESGAIPVLAARIQEFFGCRETPQLCGEPLMIHLLSPASRPVQITRDLDGFWDRAYPEVKKELMGRYPRHYWPDNPREAEPTSRAKPRG
ncbi:MAG: ATP-dependent helicase HrpB [Candidatus Gracilibacteria bacterium]|nr:ATP-dependent helicase HrpB [Candidatus Gracilibacteria bacterium]